MKQTRTFLLETLNFVQPASARFGKNNYRHGPLYFVSIQLCVSNILHGDSLVKTSGTITKVTGCEDLLRCYIVRSGVSVLAKGFQIAHEWSGFKIFSLKLLRNVIESKCLLSVKMLYKIHLTTYFIKKNC